MKNHTKVGGIILLGCVVLALSGTVHAISFEEFAERYDIYTSDCNVSFADVVFYFLNILSLVILLFLFLKNGRFRSTNGALIALLAYCLGLVLLIGAIYITILPSIPFLSMGLLTFLVIILRKDGRSKLKYFTIVQILSFIVLVFRFLGEDIFARTCF
jgi:hypothetical protein